MFTAVQLISASTSLVWFVPLAIQVTRTLDRLRPLRFKKNKKKKRKEKSWLSFHTVILLQ